MSKDIHGSDHIYGMDGIIANIIGDNSNVEIQPQQIKEVLQDIMKQDGVLDTTVIGSGMPNSDTLNIDSILNENNMMGSNIGTGSNYNPFSVTEAVGRENVAGGNVAGGNVAGGNVVNNDNGFGTLFDIKTPNNNTQYNHKQISNIQSSSSSSVGVNSAPTNMSEHEGFNVLTSVVSDYNNQTMNFIPKNNTAIQQQGNNMSNNIINNIVVNEDKVDYRELITALRYALESEGENVNDIPQITGQESIEVLTDIHKILDRRYNRKLDYEIGEGVFTTIAKVVEDTFDGTKTFFNSKPNLKGLTPKIQKTISHMKIETANEVARFRNKYFPGFIGRFLMTIVPTVYLLASNNAERDAEISAGEGTSNFTTSDLRKSISESIN